MIAGRPPEMPIEGGARWGGRRRPAVLLGGLVLLVAAASLLVPAAPDYDAWSWLIWGREVAALDLVTDAGPAWKPLPVMVTTVLAPLGGAAPEAWLVVARAGAVVAVLAAGRLAFVLAGRSWPAAILAGGGVLLTEGFARHAGVGDAEGLLAGLALLAAERALADRARTALLLAGAAALVRVEAWPFAVVLGLLVGLRHPRLRPLGVGLAVLVPALWVLPEIWGSGDLLRSSARARLLEAGAPGLAERPALASAGVAFALVTPLVWAGALAAAIRPPGPRPGLVRAGALAGLGWIVLVTLMAEVGYSGEARYHLPGAVALAVPAAVALARVPALLDPRRRRPRLVGSLCVLVTGVSVVPALAHWRADVRQLARLERSTGDLQLALRRSGGPAAVAACGRPYTGRFRGPIVAWHLGVHKPVVGFAPRAPGVAFRSRLPPGGPLTPEIGPGRGDFHEVARAGGWRVEAGCARVRVP